MAGWYCATVNPEHTSSFGQQVTCPAAWRIWSGEHVLYRELKELHVLCTALTGTCATYGSKCNICELQVACEAAIQQLPASGRQCHQALITEWRSTTCIKEGPQPTIQVRTIYHADQTPDAWFTEHHAVQNLQSTSRLCVSAEVCAAAMLLVLLYSFAKLRHLGGRRASLHSTRTLRGDWDTRPTIAPHARM